MTRHPSPNIVRVVVGVDFSDPSLHAVRWAARHFAPRAELILVHVLQLPSDPLSFGDRPAQRERVIETARAGAAIRLRELTDTVATGLVSSQIRVGTPDEEIVRVAEEFEADLIVVGRREGRAGVGGWVGSTAQRVLRRSSVPVLLARDHSAVDSGRVVSRLLVAVDDSDMTAAVLEWGQHLTDRFSGETTVLHVLDISHSPSIATPLGGPVWAHLYIPRHGPPATDGHVGYAERWLAGRLRGVAGSERMIPSVVARPSRHADVIIAEAEICRADLVVLGSRGAGAVSRLLFGSVADRVLLGASCSVLVVTGSATPRDARASKTQAQQATSHRAEKVPREGSWLPRL